MTLKLHPKLGKFKTYIYYEEFTSSSYAIPRKKTKDFKSNDLLSATSDKIFKIMFQSNKKYMAYLLTQIFNVKAEYLEKNMRVLNSELAMNKTSDKNERVDFIGVLDDELLSVEMNNVNTLMRNERYIDRVADSYVDGEGNYCKMAIQVNINNFSIRGVDECIVVSETTDGRHKRTKKGFIDIWLTNMNRMYKNGRVSELDENERRILAMFAGKKSIITELIGKDETLMEYVENLEKLKNNKSILDLYDYGIAEKHEYEREGMKKGMKKGMRKGIKKGKLEMIKNMFNNGMSKDDISYYTNVSREDIEKMLIEV